jgi:ketopantoate reductase
VIGHERVLLGFPTDGGTMDGDVVRYRPADFMTRRVPMPVGEPDGRATPRLERIVRAFRAAGINAKAEPQMDAWLKTHAAFAVPLGQAVLAAGGPVALADDPGAVRAMIRLVEAEPGRHADAGGPSRVRCVADSAGRAARGHAAALLAEPDGRTQRTQQRHACRRGGRTRADGRTDACLCEGPVADRRLYLLGRIARSAR